MTRRRNATPEEIAQAQSMAASGMASREIAESMGVAGRTVRGWLLKPPRQASASEVTLSKISVQVDPETVSEVDVIAAEQGSITKAQVMRNAWLTYRDIMRQMRAGAERVTVNVYGGRP